ncbi:MAG TPA: response regulator [Candidatus Omnitrophica bacterium]|nr:response regulator [Candidatus Omnitrophota bacterium]
MKNLLIVSEYEEIGESLRVMLEDTFMIFSTSYSREALRILKERPIDITIIDTPLRQMDLLQFIREMKNMSPENIPIVLLSTSDETIKEELVENKVYEWTAKPFKRRELIYLIQRAEERVKLIKRAKTLGKEKKESEVKVKEQHTENWSFYNEEDLRRLFYYYQETLRKFSQILTSIFEPEKLFEMIVTTLGEVFEVGKLALLLKDKDKSFYTIRSALRISKDVVREFKIKEGDGIAGWLSKNGQILIKESRDISPAMREEMELLESEVCIPLFSNGELLGFLSLAKKITGGDFSTSELKLIYMMSSYAALAIQNSYLYNEIIQHKRHLADIMENIPSGVITINNEGKITTMNNSALKILGIDEKTIGEDIQKAGSIIADIMLRTVKEEKIYHRSEVIYPGKNIPLGISAVPLKNKSEVKGALMIFQDLTEIKKLQQRMDKAKEEDLWRELARRIAHEIRNPLVSISTFAQLLPEKIHVRKSTGGDEANFIQDYYTTVLEGVEKLNKVISRLEKFSESSKADLSLGNINSMLKDVVKEFDRELKDRNIQLKRVFSDSVPNSYIDIDQLREAFSNLVRNSLSAMPEGGELEIESIYEADSRQIKITFRDTGKGIEYKDMPQVYSPFFTTEHKGFGLGLPITRKIIEKHGGGINIVSVPKKGTTVTVSIPFTTSKEEVKEGTPETGFFPTAMVKYTRPSLVRNNQAVKEGLSLEEEVANMERRLINEALEKAGGVKVKAAKLLKISRRMLAYKMEKLDIKG